MKRTKLVLVLMLMSIALNWIHVAPAAAGCTIENNPRFDFGYDTSTAVASVTFRPARCLQNLEGPLKIFGMMGRDIGANDPTSESQTHIFDKCSTDTKKCTFRLKLDHPVAERALYYGYFDFDAHDASGNDFNGSVDFSIRCTSLVIQGSCPPFP